MVNNPLVSVIVPVYNVEQYLRGTLDCICGQTLRDIEIILIDDGSTDATPLILQEYADKDSRITLLKQKNMFAGTARNRGITHARGKYFSFLDSDDIFEPTMLERMVAQAEKHEADVVICRGHILKEDGNVVPLPNLFEQFLTGINRECFRPTDEIGPASCLYFQGYAWDKLFRASYVLEHGFQFGTCHHGNDNPFVVPAMAKAGIVSIMDAAFVKYRQSPTQLTTTKSFKKAPLSCFDSLRDVQSGFDKIEVPEVVALSYKCWILKYLGWNVSRLDPESLREMQKHVTLNFEPVHQLLQMVAEIEHRENFKQVRDALNWGLSHYKKAVLPLECRKQGVDMPLVTVVTVVYNIVKNGRADFLRQCIDSVHAQSYPRIEHLIIDGASTDGTLDMIAEYEELGWVRCVSEPDKGIYDAMNKGIAHATGKYTVFMNSDDFWHDNTGVDMTVALMEKSQADFCYAPITVASEEGKHLSVDYPEVGCFFACNPFCHQTVFTRTDALRKAGGFDLAFKLIADYDLMCRIMLQGAKPVYVPLNFATFRVGGVSSSPQAKGMPYQERNSCHRKLYGSYASEEECDKIRDGYVPGRLLDIILSLVHPTMLPFIQRCVAELSGQQIRITRRPIRLTPDGKVVSLGPVYTPPVANVPVAGDNKKLEAALNETKKQFDSIKKAYQRLELERSWEKDKCRYKKARLLSQILWGRRRKHYQSLKFELKLKYKDVM